MLHIHDYRVRILRGDLVRETLVLRFCCANSECRARWQVLPELIARHLHRSWPVVEAAVKEGRRSNQSLVPNRTRARWRRRLLASGRRLVQALSASGEQTWQRLARAVGSQASRMDLVERFGDGLGSLAALVHLLVPGVRLM
jgi:hypothetical protein